MHVKLLRWAVFGVLFAVLPFVGSWLAWCAQYHHTKVDFYFYYLWERGELLIVSAAFAADAIGECISLNPQFLALRVTTAGFCLLMMFVEAIWFALLQFSKDAYDPKWISYGSIGLFLVTLVTAGVCKTIAALAEETRKQG